MENEVENVHGTETHRKSRSLDLKSLYKSSLSREVQKKRKVSAEDGDERKNEKKSKKEVSLSSLRNVNSKHRKSLNEVYDGGLSSSRQDSKDLNSWSGQKLNCHSGFNKFPLTLDDNITPIPKRKRGFVGKKKSVATKVPQVAAQSDGKVSFVGQKAAASSNDTGAPVDPQKKKQDEGFDDFKENRKNESNSALHLKEEVEHTDWSAVNAGNLSLRRPRKNPRKQKKTAPPSKNTANEDKVVDSLDNSAKKLDESREDEEENLEENAARMLSSRFNPSCTGFSSNSKSSALQSANGSSFLLSSSHSIVGSGSRSLSGSESESGDNDGRVLRPRKRRKEKGGSRKRRHFYEVSFKDLDAKLVLNRKIKVFWPLDQSWYYGLVNEYDSERKLHHVKYADRDEEWINLESERFKLLLLPSEVPAKAEQKNSVSRNTSSVNGKQNLVLEKQKARGESTVEDGSIGGSFMDSEPIISWLTRSTHRGKFPPAGALKKQKNSGLSNSVPQSSSKHRNNASESKIPPSHALKKQKTADLSLNSMPLLSRECTNLPEYSDDSSYKKDKQELPSYTGFRERLGDAKRLETSEGPSCSKDSKLPIVYSRRRFRKTDTNEIMDSQEQGTSLGRLKSYEPLWARDITGLLKLTFPLIESQKFSFEFSLPIHFFRNLSLETENYLLYRAVMLLQYGTLTTMSPKVSLEMLFIDNVVGLRFLLFEGCLRQAVALVFLVMTMFCSAKQVGKSGDLQLPVTSIRFKISLVQDFRKQFVFVFHKFSETQNSRWIHLDSRLFKHCSLTKQLSLAECTYDNIKALQNATNQLPLSPSSTQPSSVEGKHKKCRQGVNIMGVCSEAAFLSVRNSSWHCNGMPRNVSPFALSFTASPSFFLSLHQKLLMKHFVAQICIEDPDSVEHPENCGNLMVDECSSFNNCSEKGQGNTLESSPKVSLARYDVWSSAPAASGPLSDCGHEDWMTSSQKDQNNKPTFTEPSAAFKDPRKIGANAIEQWQNHQPESEQFSPLPMPLANIESSDTGPHDLSVEIPSVNEFDKPVDLDLHSAQQSMDLTWNMNAGVIPSPNPTAPRSTWNRNRSSLSSFGLNSHGRSDGKVDIFNNGFGSGPKKPRTQVSYSSPFGGFGYGVKNRNHQQKGIPNKRIRKDTEKRSLDVSRGSQRNLEMLSCDANVLLTVGDRGWRECGVRVALELFDHNEWKLAVKLSGTTKYSFKAHQLLQPGSTNRFTHAMMWKGGKDWTLEFPDRSQWTLFKEIHEECYNRNIRAASAKNIPIPGVRLIEECVKHESSAAFVRNSLKYFQQEETDVEMALDSSRILYDMDSDDEEWVVNSRNSSEVGSCGLGELSDEMFEKVMDMLEKAAYTQQRETFTTNEIEELAAGFVTIDLVKTIYEYWRQKRLKKGTPLIRHLQPPLWERYQQEVKEWELAMTKNCSSLSNGWQEKAASVEKPPMSAFCLKPRGMEVSNKGLKQRSHRKISLAGQSNAISGEHDNLHGFVRRMNGFASFREEKISYPGHNYELLDDSSTVGTSPRLFAPQERAAMGYLSLSHDGFDRSLSPKFHRSKSKRLGTYLSPVDPNRRMMGKRNGGSRWNMGYFDLPSQHYYHPDRSHEIHIMEQLDGSDLDEFKLRDASGAAKHALNMAKLKREKAHRLIYRADLAINKAVVALMTAEAIKASSQESNVDGTVC